MPSASAQTVSINPSSQDVSLFSDEVATVEVYITGVTDLCGFEFDLDYNYTTLEITSPNSVSEGSFLSSDGSSTDWTSPTLSDGAINNTAHVRLKESGEEYVGVDGSGVMATVQFSIMKDQPPGRSYLDLSGIKLSDKDAQSITFSSSSGYIDIRECLSGEVRSCLVCGVEGTRTCGEDYEWGPCSATCPEEICDGEDNNQDGYIDNDPGQGDYTLNQTCSVNYQGICAVGNETCTEQSGWAGCPEPETEICNDIDEDCDGDNTECVADIDESGCVNILDITFISIRFGLTPLDSGWDDKADLVQNNVIDIFDLVMVARDFGNGPGC